MPDREHLRHGSDSTQTKSVLMHLLDEKGIDPDVVSALAGDRDLTPHELEMIEELRRHRGPEMYVDLLLAITQQYFPVEQAEQLWNAILLHKFEMSEALERNVTTTVAALDYLSMTNNIIDRPVLISAKRMATVAEVALKDGMTKLFDHATFMAKLAAEVSRHERYGDSLSLIMFDIDHFKKINDTYGHARGDAILVQMGQIIREEIREVDIAARYGGEEFVLLLPRTGRKPAVMIAERLRQRVKATFAESEGVTISLGIASCPENAASPGDLVEAADRALYDSKRGGRNRSTLQTENLSSDSAAIES